MASNSLGAKNKAEALWEDKTVGVYETAAYSDSVNFTPQTLQNTEFLSIAASQAGQRFLFFAFKIQFFISSICADLEDISSKMVLNA